MPDIVAGLCSKQNKRKHFFGKAVTLGVFFGSFLFFFKFVCLFWNNWVFFVLKKKQ